MRSYFSLGSKNVEIFIVISQVTSDLPNVKVLSRYFEESCLVHGKWFTLVKLTTLYKATRRMMDGSEASKFRELPLMVMNKQKVNRSSMYV